MLWWQLRKLKSQDIHTRQKAIKALELSHDRRAVVSLVTVLKDSDASLRRAAAEALGKIRNSQAIKPLQEALEDVDFDVRKAVAETLQSLKWQPKDDLQKAKWLVALREWENIASLGESAIDPLLTVLKTKGVFAAEAARALGKIGDSRAIDALIVTFKTSKSNPNASEAILEALGMIGGSQIVTPMIKVLKDVNSPARSSVVKLLGKIGGKQALEALIEALNDINIQDAAAEELGNIGDERAIEPLVMMLKYGYYRQVAAVRALTQFGSAAIKPLVEALTHQESYVRQVVAEALQKLNWQPENDYQRACLAVASGEWEKAVNLREAALEPLKIALMGSRNPLIHGPRPDIGVRNEAAKALGRIGGELAAEALVAALSYGAIVREVTEEMLIKIGEYAFKPLSVVLEGKDMSLQTDSIQILGKIGDVRAITPLIATLKRAFKDEQGNSYVGDVAKKALEFFLESKAEHITKEELLTLAQLDLVQTVTVYDKDYDDDRPTMSYLEETRASHKERIPVNCYKLNQLAKQELIRRGMKFQ